MTRVSAQVVQKRRVLLVDDSRTIRALLRATLDADSRLQVVGEAANPYEAREMIKALNPDVITLDVEMPGMSGLDFLDKLMRLRPMPVVMVSTRTREKSDDAVRALSIGAVDCIEVSRLQSDAAVRGRLSELIYCASLAQVRAGGGPRMAQPRAAVGDAYRWNGRIVLVGSSTGGVDAIERMLAGFPADGPPILIAQHMPGTFLRSFGKRLDETLAPRVRLAEDGDQIRQGEVLLAPGGTHHLSVASGSRDTVRLEPCCEADLYVPSVERLFASAVHISPKIVGVMLTGMGRDGAEALAGLLSNGAVTLAQSSDTCVVDGMPRAARELNAVTKSVAIDQMGAEVLELCRARRAS